MQEREGLCVQIRSWISPREISEQQTQLGESVNWNSSHREARRARWAIRARARQELFHVINIVIPSLGSFEHTKQHLRTNFQTRDVTLFCHMKKLDKQDWRYVGILLSHCSTLCATPTPPRTVRIRGLKHYGEKWSRIFDFEILRAPSGLLLPSAKKRIA